MVVERKKKCMEMSQYAICYMHIHILKEKLISYVFRKLQIHVFSEETRSLVVFVFFCFFLFFVFCHLA